MITSQWTISIAYEIKNDNKYDCQYATQEW